MKKRMQLDQLRALILALFASAAEIHIGYSDRPARVPIAFERDRPRLGRLPSSHIEKMRAEVDSVPKSARAQMYVDRPIRVGAYTIGPAYFEFVILESETGLDRLYIQDLSAISSRRRLAVPAHVTPTDDRWSQGELVYENTTEEIPEVLGIRFPMRKIRPIG